MTERDAFARRIELARSFIAREYNDPAQELRGDWIDPRAKPAHDALCLCLQDLSAPAVSTGGEPVALMQRVWANLYFNEADAGYTFQQTLNEVVDWLTARNALPGDAALPAPKAAGDIEAALRSFPHFMGDVPITVDAINALAAEYLDMTMTWEPQKSEIEFFDQNGATRKLEYIDGDDWGGWSIPDNVDWQVADLPSGDVRAAVIDARRAAFDSCAAIARQYDDCSASFIADRIDELALSQSPATDADASLSRPHRESPGGEA